MKNFFSVDLEDWYQGVGLPLNQWHQFEKRLEIGTNILLDLFSKHNVKSTFFVLGKTIEDHPELLKTIKKEGHEIACHTYSHPFLYDITQIQFEEELEKCRQLASGIDVTMKGFRAPYFSVDHRSLWVLDSLKKFNYVYDSSIFPGDTKRTGIADANPDINILENELTEVPVTKFKLSRFDVGTGGAYFRILPYAFFRKKLKDAEKVRPVNFYIHPWELDVRHPILPNISKRIKYPHYFNLKSTKKKLENLFNDFEFTTFADNLKIES